MNDIPMTPVHRLAIEHIPTADDQTWKENEIHKTKKKSDIRKKTENRKKRKKRKAAMVFGGRFPPPALADIHLRLLDEQPARFMAAFFVLVHCLWFSFFVWKMLFQSGRCTFPPLFCSFLRPSNGGVEWSTGFPIRFAVIALNFFSQLLFMFFIVER